ncbi:NAD(P)/FAD-dependent oxidoreductase [Rhizobium tumorigenes]|uniref:NAD(P)/FAD-dependent oxidoreductase n=1 Tax=Rhizobium tumorigenes TaxID=2041385 RepID=UPI00241EB745|nr:NAD(P)-binding protein [Rhizobium tumorigenes]WFS04595.1 NAD(P)-binding protein [Rhizobium tumorigenes]
MAIRPRVGIIGAGIAGLTLAKAISATASVRVFEKSHGVGGRMATRWIDAVSYDHGAQYFTIRNDRFHDALETARANGVVEPWNGHVASLSDDGLLERPKSSTVRYVGIPSMNALPKSMSVGLDIQPESTVGAITGEPGRWFVNIRDRTEGPFDWVIATAPAPQSALMLPARFAHHDKLGHVRMNGCFTLMVNIDMKHSAQIPFAAAHVADPVINWISLNNSKPGRPASPCLVVNSNAVWADLNMDMPLEKVRQALIEAARRHVQMDAGEADTATVHRWRYANVERPAGEPYLLDKGSQLAACGDWCIGGRVEAAFLSAAGLGDALVALMGDAK